MNRKFYPALLILSIICLASPGLTQTYLWPTDASRLLSSSFAEWRSGHFHAGIDIKTFGRNGYPVFATRAGYIWRVRVSPYGYGKVIYQKLDTAEIVVYAHLNGFYEPLENFIKREQIRKGQYSINKYFEPDDFPVEAGQIIAFTGESGIGPPHLHFEIRDPHNRPINPLQKGFAIIDTRKPVVTEISISPIDFGSTVNDDFVPVTLKPVPVGNGQYKIQTPIRISGTVGFGVKTYDSANNATNKLGIYKLKFYLNEKLIFSAKYDRFSYATTGQIYLDRDFSLIKRNLGIFYKLYIDTGNELDFYGSQSEGTGLINEKMLRLLASNKYNQNSANDSSRIKTFGADSPDMVRPEKSVSLPALHQFRIEISDYFENTTEVSGTLLLREKFNFQPNIFIDESGIAYLADLGDIRSGQLNKVEAYVSYNYGANWNRVFRWRKPYRTSPAKALSESLTNVISMRKLVRLPRSKHSTLILKAVAEDTNGIVGFPFFKLLKTSQTLPSRKSWITLKKEFYNDRTIFRLHVSLPPDDLVRMTIHLEERPATDVELIQTGLLDYVGIYELSPDYSGRVGIEIHAQDIASRGVFFEDCFEVYPVSPETETRILSNDGQCRISVPGNSVYKPLFFRIEEFPYPVDSDSNQIGSIYRLNPFDEPFKTSIRITINYPEDFPAADKLGVYARSNPKSKWRFVGNQWDPQKRFVSTKVKSLNYYTLFRDITPPTIKSIIPFDKARLRNKKPSIQAIIRDSQSGFNSDKHLRLILDDQKVIAEFDPEKLRLFYKPDEPLSEGQHQFRIIAVDRSGNETIVCRDFWIY